MSVLADRATVRLVGSPATVGTDRTVWWSAGSGVVVAGAVFALVHGALPDDAYITLDYARELAEHHHWGMVPGLDANAATSPLNVWLLAAGIAVTGRPVVAAGVVLVLALGACAWWSSRLGPRTGWSTGALLAVLLGASPLLVSTVGLETYLAGAVLIGTARYARSSSWPTAGVLAGLAVLVRPDLAVPAAALLAALLPVRRWPCAAAVAAVVALPWHLWSWWHLGGFVPDTLWLKAGEGAWYGHRFSNGVGLYWRDFPAATAVSVLVVLAGVAAAVVTRRRVAVSAVVAAAAHAGAMSVLDPPPYAWYYAPAVMLCALALVVGTADLARPQRWIVIGLVVCVAAVGMVLVAARPRPDVAPVILNYGSSTQYVRAGVDIARRTAGEPVMSQIEIGALAFGCRCRLHDMFSDLATADRVIAARSADASPWRRRLMTWNAARRPRVAEPPYRWRVVGTPDLAATPGRRWVWPVSTPAFGVNGAALERVP